MDIAVVGTGYVGLVAGACFADSGNTVYCVDKDEKKIEALKRGEIPIYEPQLDSIVERGVRQGRLFFTTSTREAVEKSEVIFLAVGTPSLPDGSPNLSYLEDAAREIGKSMTGPRLVVNKSTVPIGSHAKVAEWISSHTSHPVDVVSNPEFLKEGTAVEDFLKPDRIIIGTNNSEAFKKMARLYSPFVRQGNPIIEMDPVSAEIAKYACNAFLATRISFMNELSNLCEKVGGDIETIRKGMVTDQRIGKHFLYAGVGYGGSCFPKDIRALLATGEENQVPLEIVRATEEANKRQKLFLIHQAERYFKGALEGKTFGIWGLAFKPNTDDIREAPALEMIEKLLNSGATVKAFDPVASENVKKVYGERVQFCESYYEAATGADAVFLVTEWNEFRHPNFEKIKKIMKAPILFDGRNIFDPETVRRNGFTYFAVGRPQQ